MANPQGARHRGQVLSASERAVSVTRQLLAFSRKPVFQTCLLDLNESVESLRNMLSRLLGEDVELTIRPGEALGRIRADPTQMEQILLNVAARDAMPNGGWLAITTSSAEMDEDYARVQAGATPGRDICLAVTDTGHGMNGEVQARIFEPFFTTKVPGKGAGLGLAIVYEIVKQSQGLIHAYSEPGQATTVKINLPRVDTAADKAVEPAPTPP